MNHFSYTHVTKTSRIKVQECINYHIYTPQVKYFWFCWRDIVVCSENDIVQINTTNLIMAIVAIQKYNAQKKAGIR